MARDVPGVEVVEGRLGFLHGSGRCRGTKPSYHIPQRLRSTGIGDDDRMTVFDGDRRDRPPMLPAPMIPSFMSRP